MIDALPELERFDESRVGIEEMLELGLRHRRLQRTKRPSVSRQNRLGKSVSHELVAPHRLWEGERRGDGQGESRGMGVVGGYD